MVLALASAIFGCTSEDHLAERPQQEPQVNRESSAGGGIYRRPLGNDPATLDPARITDVYAVAVINQIFDSLVAFDAHLNIIPALAESWSASSDSLIWTFHLRQGVQFHNGREMVADDVVYSLSRILDPTVKSPRSWFLDKIKGASAFQGGSAQRLEGIREVDRYTVEITLSEPFAPFVSILGLPHTSIVPREEVERLDLAFNTTPIGTGGFRFVQWDRGREIVLAANEHYFRGPPALDQVRFIIFPGNIESDILKAFERGELEESPIPPQGRKELLEKGQYRVIRKPMLSIRLLGFNLEHVPFEERSIRQALNYSIDKARMNLEIQGERFTVARGILPPGMPGYNPEVKTYSYDPAKAKALIAQAGHPDGEGLPPIMMGSSGKSLQVRQESEAVRDYFAAIGVQLNLREFDDWPTFRQKLVRGEFQMFRYAWYADYPDPDNFLFPLFHSKSQSNYFRYSNPTVDELLDNARRETDELRRVGLYREAEQHILNDAPGLMLLHHTYEALFQPHVEGIEVNALGGPYIPMHKIRLKSVERRRVEK